MTAELTVFYFYFWTDFKDRDVIKSRGKVMERQDGFCILFPVVTSKIMFVLDPWLFTDSWFNSSNSVIDVIDLISGLPGDLTVNRIDTLLMTLAPRFVNLKVVETNAERVHDFPFSLSFPQNKFEEKFWRYHKTSFFRAEGVHGRIVP